jgi:hypothetical protein
LTATKDLAESHAPILAGIVTRPHGHKR